MSHPWATLSREEFLHRRRMLGRTVAGMGVLLFVLLAVQFRVTFANTPEALGSVFNVANDFFEEAGSVLSRPATDTQDVLRAVGERIKDVQEVEKAKQAVIQQMASSIQNDWTYLEPEVEQPVTE